MIKRITRCALPAAIAIGALGLGVGVVGSTAGAAVPTHVALVSKSVTKSGKITTTGKDTFTFKSGKTTYKALYTSHTHFTKGDAADLKKGVTVSVTGTLVKSTITATSISA